MVKADRILIQPVWEKREAYYALAHNHGFGLEIVSFALVSVLNDPAIASEHLSGYRAETASLRCHRTLHGPFVDIIPHSPDHLVASAARERITTCLETASGLRASHVVFHTGLNWQIRNPGYIDRAARIQGQFWASLLEQFPDLTICLENMWEPDSTVFHSILKEAGHPRLKVCFDVGHAHVFSSQPVEAWFDSLANEIVYLHLNDNCGDRDSELALGRGNINWDVVFGAILAMPAPPLMTLEVNDLEALAESITFLASKGVLELSSAPGA